MYKQKSTTYEIPNENELSPSLFNFSTGEWRTDACWHMRQREGADKHTWFQEGERECDERPAPTGEALRVRERERDCERVGE